MQLESKYNFGDIVYSATTESREVRDVCPECNGAKGFEVVGKSFKAVCRRCKYNGYGDPTGYIPRYERIPSFRRLTIGQIRFEVTDSPGTDSMFDNYKPQKGRVEQYMAVETGIGSGSVYYVESLFDSAEQALVHGKILVVEEAQRAAEEIERQQKRHSEYLEIADAETRDSNQ